MGLGHHAGTRTPGLATKQECEDCIHHDHDEAIHFSSCNQLAQETLAKVS